MNSQLLQQFKEIITDQMIQRYAVLKFSAHNPIQWRQGGRERKVTYTIKMAVEHRNR